MASVPPSTVTNPPLPLDPPPVAELTKLPPVIVMSGLRSVTVPALAVPKVLLPICELSTSIDSAALIATEPAACVPWVLVSKKEFTIEARRALIWILPPAPVESGPSAARSSPLSLIRSLTLMMIEPASPAASDVESAPALSRRKVSPVMVIVPALPAPKETDERLPEPKLPELSARVMSRPSRAISPALPPPDVEDSIVARFSITSAVTRTCPALPSPLVDEKMMPPV